MSKGPLLFAIRSYRYLGDRILAAGGFTPGEVEVKIFPDGERYQRLISDISDRDVVIVGGTVDDHDTLELYDLACAVAKHGASSLSLVVPYYGYGTMERTVHPGDVITAKTRARLLSSIPTTPRGNCVILMDLHAAGVAYYFEGSVVTTHLYAKDVILEACKRLGGDNFVLASTDAGRAKWVESLANDLGMDAAFVFKRRIDGSTTELTAMNARVEGRRVIIYDDMIRTGGSLISAARAYREAGASSIAAIATHGVLPGDALQRIADTGLFEEIVVTDTHPRTELLRHPIFRVESTAKIFSAWISKHFSRD
jgi:ribose-phosphate pyrophosphokinase